ncbi:MAG: protein translocase subunit SecD [Parcubacteria group bacterium]
MKHKLIFISALVLLAVASSLFVLPEPGTVVSGVKVPDVFLNRFLPWRLGLDLVGGTALTYDIDLTGVDRADFTAVTNGLKDVIEKRIDLYGVSEPRVRVIEKGDSRQLLVELAGISEISDAVKEIGETPFLDFRENCVITEDSIVCDPTELSGRHIKRASVATSSQGVSQPVVSLEFNDEGAKLFEEITARNIGKQVAIFLDGAPISAPVVQEKIIGGKAQISGEGITLDSAQKLVERFNAGALSAPIKLGNQRTVNATAAEDSLGRILVAGVISILLIIAFIIAIYRKRGIVAGLSLILYVIFSLAIFKLTPGFTMSLSGITGFILSIGAALDANILIFERAKEELRRGTQNTQAIESGFRLAWSSIRDSNVGTVLTALILYFFTSSFVKGFALTLLVGILINIAMTYVVTRNLLRVFPGKQNNKQA